MTVIKLDWNSLRREAPDPTASSTPSGLLLTLLNATANIGVLVSLPLVIPYTLLTHFLRGPRAKWMDLRAHLITNIVRIVLLRFSFYLPGVDKREWIIPKPFKSTYRGVKANIVTLQPTKTPREGFAVCDKVQAVKRPGFMLAPEGMDGLAKAGPGEKAILYFVGGGYAFGHPLERPFAWDMAKEFDVRVLGVNYRKVLTPESSFPAPLLDALAGWDYLKDLGFEAKNITFIGESAGAHLCLLLARYLGDIGAEGPGALALSGPWCDMSPGSHNRKSMTTNYGIDYIPWLGKLSAQSAGQHYTLEARNGPYFAPAKATVEEWKFLRNTKVFVHAGAAEILIDEIRATVETMKAAGVQVTYVEEVDGVHVSPTMFKIFPTSKGWDEFKAPVKRIVKSL